MVDDTDIGGGDDYDAKKEGKGAMALRRSVTFDPIGHTNEGGKFGVPLPPDRQQQQQEPQRIVRDQRSTFAPGEKIDNPLDLGAVQRVLQRKKPAIHSMGLTSSENADRSKYVEIRPLCARHFICRQPPAVPGAKAEAAPLRPTLVCVAYFGNEESDPISINAGGVPPGYEGDTVKVHNSSEFSKVRLNLFATPNIAIGTVTLDLAAGKFSDLDDIFKLFVVDIMCPGEESRSGGYFGQFACHMRKMTTAAEGGGRGKAAGFAPSAAKPGPQSPSRAKAAKMDEKAKKFVLKAKEANAAAAGTSIHDSAVTKTYSINMACGMEKRKKIPWTGVSGTFNLISTMPEILVPLKSEIRVGLEDKVGSIKFLILKSAAPLRTEAGLVVIRKEDGFVVEHLRFKINIHDELQM